LKNEKQDKSRESVISSQFRDDLRYWAGTDRRTLIKVLDLMEAVNREPFKGIGKPEPLKGERPLHNESRVTGARSDLDVGRSDSPRRGQPLAAQLGDLRQFQGR